MCVSLVLLLGVFFFKQKTAYEMRISDWSSDVCSSDLPLLMELLSNLALGFEVAFSPVNLFYCFVGVFLGTFIGVLPGIGALAAVSMLLPVTFYLEPATALVMLAGVYYGAESGGSRSEEHTSELQSLMRISYADIR